LLTAFNLKRFIPVIPASDRSRFVGHRQLESIDPR
jgi:hypothetical protein